MNPRTNPLAFWREPESLALPGGRVVSSARFPRENLDLPAWLRGRPPEPVAASAITFSELWFGIDADENAVRARRRRRWLEKTFRRLEIVSMDTRVARPGP